MDTNDQTTPKGTSDNESSNQQSGQPSESLPNNSVEAPQSGWFKKSDTTLPDNNIESPKSHWLTGGGGFATTRNDSEDE